MRSQRASGFNSSGVTRLRRLALFAVVPAAIGAFDAASTEASAQKTWDPVVATVPGGTLTVHGQAPANRLPTMVDPRRFPPPKRAPAGQQKQGLPQGAWSPLVTGAIPKPGSPARSISRKPVAPAVKSGEVSPIGEALSPVRSTRGGAMAEVAGEVAGAAEPTAGDDTEPSPKPASVSSEDAGTVGPLDALPPNATPAQQYCFNTTDAAADARFAWQAKKIQEMEAELDKRAEILAKKTEEYKKWLARRDEFSRKAHEKLVGFYSRMRADAAAEQLATIDEETAAAVVTKLETKVASQIMGEMNPARAARIATVIAGAAKTPPADKRTRRRKARPPRERTAAEPRGRPES